MRSRLLIVNLLFLLTSCTSCANDFLKTSILSVSVFVIFSHASLAEIPGTSSKSPSIPNLGRQKWCAWAQWSRCAPVSCQEGIRPGPKFSLEPQMSSEEDDERDSATEDSSSPISYCVIEPTTKSRKVIWTALVQFTSGGLTRTRTPVKQRTRLCDCPSFSFLNIMRILGRDECQRGSTEVQCAMCSSEEPIYAVQTPSDRDRPLAFCDPFSLGTFHLYKILGAVAGGLVTALFFIWLVRIICRSMSRASRTTNAAARRSADLGSPDERRCRNRRARRSSRQRGAPAADGGRVPDPTDRGRVSPLDPDLPPAYKDVVGILPNVDVISPTGQDDGGHRFFRPFHKSSPHSRSPYSLWSGSQAPTTDASSSQTIHPPTPTSDLPPPPSYEEIVGGGICVLDMSSFIPTGGDGSSRANDGQSLGVPSATSNYDRRGDRGSNHGVVNTAIRVTIPTVPPE